MIVGRFTALTIRRRLACLGVGIALVTGPGGSVRAEEIELGSIRIETPDGDLRGREFYRNVITGLLAMRDKSPYLAQLLKAAQHAPFPIALRPSMEDPATFAGGEPYRPHAEAAGPRAVGPGGVIGYPAAIYLTLANVNPYWSESKRGMLPHELVHGVDLVYGRLHPDRLVRERRAVFMENVWRDVHGWPICERYFDGKIASFETLEYRRAKKQGATAMARCVEQILTVGSFDCP